MGSSSSGWDIIILSVLSILSPDSFDDFDNLIISGRTLTEMPASLASWKKVLMVTPVPWARRHLSYWSSVFLAS